MYKIGEMKYIFFYQFNFSVAQLKGKKFEIGIIEEDKMILSVFFGSWYPVQKDIVRKETLTIKTAANQLDQYFTGKRKQFSLPLVLKGTEFQKAVWEALQAIPYGETRSYSDIAVAVGSPKAVRAVGMANHNNPIAIIVPCHRVIGKNGSLTGYASGLQNKKLLLELEQTCRSFLQ